MYKQTGGQTADIIIDIIITIIIHAHTYLQRHEKSTDPLDFGTSTYGWLLAAKMNC